jgi:uncharacterized lipoprotein YmbA
MWRRRWVLWSLAAWPAACSSPNPTLYVVAAEPGTVRNGAPRIIELRAIGLPRYLERSQIVKSSEGYRMDVLANEWWGEPLDAMLARVLVEELGQRLSGSTVYAEAGAITTGPDAMVEVNLQRFDLDRQGEVLLMAQVAVEARGSSTRSVRFTERPANATTGALVAAMSVVTARLADMIAAMLARGGVRGKGA